MKEFFLLRVILPSLNLLYRLPELFHQEERKLISICQLSAHFFKPCMAHKIVDAKRVTLHHWHGTWWPKFLLDISCHRHQQKPYTNPPDEPPRLRGLYRLSFVCSIISESICEQGKHVKNIWTNNTVTNTFPKNPINCCIFQSYPCFTDDQCRPNPNSVLVHMYLPSCDEDHYWRNIPCRRLCQTPLDEVVKYLPLGPMNKNIFHRFPARWMVAPPLIFSDVVYVLG